MAAAVDNAFVKYPVLSIALKEGLSKANYGNLNESLSLTMIKADVGKAETPEQANEIFDRDLKNCVIRELNTSFLSFEHEESFKPTCRVLLLTDPSGNEEYVPDALIVSLPQYFADPLSTLAFTNDLLNLTRESISGTLKPITTPAPILQIGSSILKKSFGMASNFFSNMSFKYNILSKRRTIHNVKYDMFVEKQERNSLFDSFTLQPDVIASIKKAAKEHGVSITSFVSAVVLKSANVLSIEKVRAPKKEPTLLLNIYDDIRKTLDPPIEPEHLGSLWGSIINSYPINKEVWELARSIDSYNQEYVKNGNLVRSRKLTDILYHENEDIKGVNTVKNPSLEVVNLGVAPISPENVEFFGIDQLSLAMSHNPISFLVNCVTLPNGSMTFAINYPYPIFFEETAIQFKEELRKNIIDNIHSYVK